MKGKQNEHCKSEESLIKEINQIADQAQEESQVTDEESISFGSLRPL